MKDKNKQSSDFALSYRDHFQITVKIAFTTISMMALFGGGGYLIDKKIDTFPILFIIGLVISFPLIQILVYKQTKGLINSTEQQRGSIVTKKHN